MIPTTAIFLFALRTAFSLQSITFYQGSDWNNSSNWDLGFVPTNASFEVTINSNVSLPPTLDVGWVYVRSAILSAGSVVVNCPIQIYKGGYLSVSGTVTGTGNVSGADGVVLMHTGGALYLPLVGSSIRFDGGYVHSYVYNNDPSYVLGGSFEDISIGTFSLKTTGMDPYNVNNLTVGDFSWTGGQLRYNLKVLGTVQLTGQTSYVIFNQFYVVNDTLDHIWVYGHISMNLYTDIVLKGHWHCNSTDACYFSSSGNSGKLLLSGSFDALGTGEKRTYINAGQVTTSALFIGGLFLATGTNATFNGGTSFSGEFGFNGTKLDITTSISFENFNMGSISSVANIYAENVTFVILKSAGNIHSEYDVAITHFITFGDTNLYGDVQYLVQTMYKQENTLAAYNSSIILQSGCVATIKNSLFLYGSSHFANWGEISWNGDHLYIDSEGAFLNIGSFNLMGTNRLIVEPITTGVSGGKWVNLGDITTFGSNHLTFEDVIPFYQCKTGSLNLNFEAGIPYLLLDPNAVINGKINIFFDSQSHFDAISSSGIPFGEWGTRYYSIGTSAALQGDVLTFTVINGTFFSNLGVICQNVTSSNSSFLFKKNDSLPKECSSFDLNISSNTYCNILPTPTPTPTPTSRNTPIPTPTPRPYISTPTPTPTPTPISTPTPTPISTPTPTPILTPTPTPTPISNPTPTPTRILVSNTSLSNVISLRNGEYLLLGTISHFFNMTIINSLVDLQGSLNGQNVDLSLKNSNLVISNSLHLKNSHISMDVGSQMTVLGDVDLKDTELMINVTYPFIGHYVILTSDYNITNFPATIKFNTPICTKAEPLQSPRSISVVISTEVDCPNSSTNTIIGVVCGVLFFIIVLIGGFIAYKRHYDSTKELTALAVSPSS